MRNYIYINPTSLPPTICDEIVEQYENESTEEIDPRYNGITAGGMNKKVKNTLDLALKIKNISETSKWYKYTTLLTKVLTQNLMIYKEQIDPTNTHYNFDEIYKNIFFTTFLLQRYKQNEGKYVYHIDSMADFDERKYRKLTYLWYLNDVTEGGETEFFGNYKVVPEKGKMVIFPAEFMFPHTGMMPKSNDKYIATGWIYCDF